jgi:hypothetical protein
MLFTVIYQYRNRNIRKAKFIQIANDCGMSNVEHLEKTVRNRLKSLDRFRNAPYGGFKNVLREKKGNVEILFFECYRHQRKNSNSLEPWVREGIFCFNSTDLNLPLFSLHKALELQQLFLNTLGYEDINFENYPVFSKKYLLNSSDKIAVNKFFNKKLISFLEDLDGFNIEGCDTQLIVYRPNVRIDPQNFKQLKKEAYNIFKEFRG